MMDWHWEYPGADVDRAAEVYHDDAVLCGHRCKTQQVRRGALSELGADLAS